MQLPVTVEQFLLFVSLVVQVGFGITIWTRGQKNQVRTAFVSLVAGIVVWTSCLLMWVMADNAWLTVWSLRMSFVAPPLMMASFVWLSSIVSGKSQNVSVKSLGLLYFPAALLSLISFSPWIVSASPFPRGLYTQYGFIHPVYVVFLIAYLVIGIAQLFHGFLHSKGRRRLQIWYIFVGSFLAATISVTVNLLLPLFVRASAFVNVGPFSVLFFLGFASYAIVRFRLLAIYDFLRRLWSTVIIFSAALGLVLIMATQSHGFIPYFFVAHANVALGTLLIIHNWRSRLHLSFSIVPLAIAVWAVSIYFVRTVPDPLEAIIYGRMAFFSVTFIPAAILYFAWLFPDYRKTISPIQVFALAVPILFFLSAAISGGIVQGTEFVSGVRKTVYGPIYPYFSLYILGYTLWFLGVLFQKYRTLQGLNQLQIRYIIWGLSGMFGVAITSNLILPMLGIPAFNWLGPFASLLLVGAVSYSILRYRLMSVEFVLRRGAMYTLVMLLTIAVYAVSALIFERFFFHVTPYQRLFTTIFTALVVTVTFQPLIHALQWLFEKWFYPIRYDYQRTLQETSREISSVIQLDQLVNLVVGVFVTRIGISEISLLLFQKDSGRFRSVSPDIVRESQAYRFLEIPEESNIVRWLQQSRGPLFRDEIRAQLERAELEGDRRRIWDLSQVRGELDRIGTDNWVPIFLRGKLRAILVLGYKLSGDIYTAEDVHMITTLAHQIAVALENTGLYEQIVSLKDYSENVFHSLASGVLTTDRDGALVTLNNFAEQMLGLSSRDICGRKVEKIWNSHHPIVVHVYSALRGREMNGSECEWELPSGTVMPALISSRPLMSRGKSIGALLILQDQTAVRALEAQIRRADKLAAIGTMAAGMAHEIKNPLSSMKVLVQLLPERFQDSTFRKKLQNILPKEIERIDRIVEGLLSFARTTVPRKSRVDINQIVRDAISESTEQAARGKVKIEENLERVPPVLVDTLQLQQVFANLLRNGIEAMPDGGVLRVDSRLWRSSGNGTQNMVEVVISDTGHGIPPDRIAKLFDPFYTTKHGGTGLGLAISHSVIQNHDGSIQVESAPGQGTKFVVKLPVEVPVGTT